MIMSCKISEQILAVILYQNVDHLIFILNTQWHVSLRVHTDITVSEMHPRLKNGPVAVQFLWYDIT